MKKQALLMVSAVFLALAGMAFGQSKKPAAVASIDLQKFAGTWYEIARYPNKFQKNCAGNVTVVYTRKSNGGLEVNNQCLGVKGITEAHRSDVKTPDAASNAKMKGGWGEQWIIDLDPHYQYAAISDPKGENLWILSRTRKMSDAVYQAILRRVEKMGINPGKAVKTPQNVELVKGAVIEKP